MDRTEAQTLDCGLGTENRQDVQMTNAARPGHASYQVLSTKTIWAGALVLAVVAAGTVWLLLATSATTPTATGWTSSGPPAAL
jgi:hypothetical protein